MPQQASQERRTFLITVVAIVLVAGGLGAVVVWAVRARAILQKDIRAVNKEISGYQKRIDEIPKLQVQLKTLEASQKKILEKLPKAHEIDALLEQINNESARAGVELKAFRKEKVPRAAKGKAAAPHDTFIYSMVLSGRYEQFVNFIYQVEYEMPRFVKVDSFRVEAHEAGLAPDQPKHTFDVKLSTMAYAGKSVTPAKTPARKSGGSAGGGAK
jgi:Tfp pilus assembly protein PilO